MIRGKMRGGGVKGEGKEPRDGSQVPATDQALCPVLLCRLLQLLPQQNGKDAINIPIQQRRTTDAHEGWVTHLRSYH